MKFVTLSLLATALTVGGNAAEQARSSKQPNILFILADDFGWRDLACTGSRYYESPNIDGIARNGVRFTQGYAACQVSSPSRASIMTGKFTARHGITNWIGEGSGEEWRKMGRHSKLLPAQYVWQLPKEDITLPEALKAHGYKTFMAGKWHLGGEGSYPEDHGFDINIGGHEAGGPYPGGYFAPYGNPKMKEGPDGENLSMRLAHETASFIETHTRRNKKQPFFAFLSFYAVHAPIETLSPSSVCTIATASSSTQFFASVLVMKSNTPVNFAATATADSRSSAASRTIAPFTFLFVVHASVLSVCRMRSVCSTRR